MSDEQPRQAVIAAGAEVIKAACAFVEGRTQEMSASTRKALYQRLESAVTMFQELTDDE